MAHFRGTIRGQRGEASRLGSSKSGLVVTCNGWESGVYVQAEHTSKGDRFLILSNGGSNGRGEKKLGVIGEDGKFYPSVGLIETIRNAKDVTETSF